jgi:hypothetical protein
MHLFIARLVTRPRSASEVILFMSDTLHVASCHVRLGYFLTTHLGSNDLVVSRYVGKKNRSNLSV